MRFLANRSELLPVVRRCSQTIGRYFESRERTCVLMEADQQTNTVMFTARGRSCTLQVRQPCRVEQGGKAMLFASVFQRILESFADETTFIASDDSRIEVRNAKALFEFPLLDVSKYPVPETPSPAMLLDCSGFAEVSAKVLFSAAQGRDIVDFSNLENALKFQNGAQARRFIADDLERPESGPYFVSELSLGELLEYCPELYEVRRAASGQGVA